MDSRSETALATLYPPFAASVRAAADQLALKGTYLLVVSGLRTAQQQNDLYAQGRTAAGHKVTNAKAGFSMHNYGLAVDIVPYLTGQTGNLNWTEDTPQYQAMVKALKAQKLTWGGDWVSIHDGDHFQAAGLPDTPTATMRNDYAAGDLAAIKAIWAKFAAGGYSI